MLIDLHVHSHHSPGGGFSPRELVRRAREVGLDGIVLTDLHALDGLDEVRAAGKEEGILALCGVEVATDHGHYLCCVPDPARTPAPAQLFGPSPWPVRQVIEKVRELGGAVVAAHPYDKAVERPSGDFIFTLEGLAALEGLCARRSGPVNDLAIEAADHMNLPCVGGSGVKDALTDLGRAATLFREPVATEADLVRQLLGGHVHCVAIGAPALEGGRERSAAPRRTGERGERGRGGRGGRRERR